MKWQVESLKHDKLLKITARRPEKFDVSNLLQETLTDGSRRHERIGSLMNVSGSYSLENDMPKPKAKKRN